MVNGELVFSRLSGLGRGIEDFEALEGGRESGLVVRRCGEGVVRDDGGRL